MCAAALRAHNYGEHAQNKRQRFADARFIPGAGGGHPYLVGTGSGLATLTPSTRGFRLGLLPGQGHMFGRSPGPGHLGPGGAAGRHEHSRPGRNCIQSLAWIRPTGTDLGVVGMSCGARTTHMVEPDGQYGRAHLRHCLAAASTETGQLCSYNFGLDAPTLVGAGP